MRVNPEGTKKSVTRFNGAFEAAKAVLNNSKASTDEIKKADSDLAAAKSALKNKKANPITVKGKKVYTKAFTVNSKTGKITVRKGLKKGLYKLKIKVTASGNGYYKSRSRTVTVRIKIR